MHFWKQILLFAFFLTANLSWAGNAKIDSLLRVLKSAKNKQIIYNELAENYRHISADSSLYYAGFAVKEAMLHADTLEIFAGYRLMGIANMFSSRLDSALVNLFQAYSYAKQSHNDSLIALASGNLGAVYTYLSDFDRAIDYQLKALLLSEKNDYPLLLAAALTNLSLLYRHSGEYGTAIAYSQKAIEIFRKAKRLKKLAAAYNNLALVYVKLKDYETALKYYNKSLKIRTLHGNTRSYTGLLINMANVYINQSKFLEAHKLLKIASKKSKPFPKLQANVFFTLGTLHQRLGLRKKAFAFHDSALQIAVEYRFLDLERDIYSDLVAAFAKQKKYKQAYEYQLLKEELSDSLIIIENKKQIEKLEISYQVEKFRDENKLLKKNTEIIKLNVVKEKVIRNSLIIMALLFFATLILFYSRQALAKKYAAKLEKKVKSRTAELVDEMEKHNATLEHLQIALQKAEESDKLKTAFLANLSHEVRTPMNGIIGFAHLLEKPNLDKEQIKEYSSYISSQSQQLLFIITNIVEASKIQAGQTDIQKTKVLIDELFEDLEYGLSTENKSVKLNFFSDNEEHHIYSDENRLNIILSNLILNSIKFTYSGSIDVNYRFDESKKRVTFIVKDTGIGISPYEMEHIFKSFRQGEHKKLKENDGTGLGLFVIKGLLDAMGGELEVKSELKKGTEIRFTLPVN